MKTQLLTLALFGVLFQNPIFAQDRTTVNATSNEISENLDLRAVASIFGDSKDLQDFEQRLNDPRNKISNLDLNYDRQVDYLRVIEAVEKNTHLIILQAVLEQDVFQDVATIEVERDRNNQVQIQVVGDVFMYGPNYIYEPVYVSRPLIYNVFWVHNYNPYYSPYYYNYYPSYYYAWTPYPIYRYRRNVHIHINEYNHYNYSNHRRSSNAVALYETRRSNGYERNYDKYTSQRNENKSTRNTSGRRDENTATRNQTANTSGRNTGNANTTGVRNENSGTRTQTSTTPSRSTVGTRDENGSTRNENSGTRTQTSSTPTRNTTNTVGTRSENPANIVRNNTTTTSTRSDFAQQTNVPRSVNNANNAQTSSRNTGSSATRNTASQERSMRQATPNTSSSRNTAQVNDSRGSSNRTTATSSRGGRN
ncbi:hypothetical protein FLAN108750_13300 [Flavobacterium antarcticum]|uniref:hypothetical protein n=1 Tax=Flavobacterium antarcticum TaxID=271155 RepID=UPI0003B526A7|nr:hypothetical protein [Flavobacterium antarcticum]